MTILSFYSIISKAIPFSLFFFIHFYRSVELSNFSLFLLRKRVSVLQSQKYFVDFPFKISEAIKPKVAEINDWFYSLVVGAPGGRPPKLQRLYG